MKWTHATGLMSTVALIAAGGVWVGCNGDNTQTDAGGNDSGGSDVSQNNDTGTKDSGSNDAANDTGSNDGGPTVDGAALDCTYYCANIATVCTGNNNQYKDNATCMAMCSAGVPNDAGAGAQSGDSLACRMYHLSVASTSTAFADIHCPHAGPYGYGVCGSLCEDFCNQYFTSICKTDTTTGFANRDACNTYCKTAAGSDAGAGAPGNSASTPALLCREYHLENAVQTGGTGGGHCDHAGLTGGGVCP